MINSSLASRKLVKPKLLIMILNSKKQTILTRIAALFFSITTALAIVPINVGVALPLHNEDGDGRRAIEYYRGLILAAEEMKQEGIEVNFYAWNVHKDADVNIILQDPNAKKCDFFFGPMYTKQVPALQSFAEKNGAKVIIPFSISNDPAGKYGNVFQVYMEPPFARQEATKRFSEYFSNSQVVVVGCNDAEVSNGDFTSALRTQLAVKNIPVTLTSLTTKDELFAKAFNTQKPNVVVLNSSSNASLKEAFKKLETLAQAHPDIKFSLFGYTDWLTYTEAYSPFYHKFDTFIPTHSFFNPNAPATKVIMEKYKQTFNCEMLSQYNPRFGLMGYDHGRFFFRGFSKMGKDYKGVYANNDALQSRIHFAQVGRNGGMQNVGFKFIHFKKDNSVSEVSF